MRCPRAPRGFDPGLAALVLLVELALASAGDWQPRVRMGGSLTAIALFGNSDARGISAASRSAKSLLRGALQGRCGFFGGSLSMIW